MRVYCQLSLFALFVALTNGIFLEKKDSRSVIVAVRVSEAFRCSGTIISPRTVVTAASCVMKGDVFVDAGSVDIVVGADAMPVTITTKFYEMISAIEMRIIKTHEDVSDGSPYNLAMIAVEKNFEGNPMNLPALSYRKIDNITVSDVSTLFDDSDSCQIYGWYFDPKTKVYKPDTRAVTVQKMETCSIGNNQLLACVSVLTPDGMTDMVKGSALFCRGRLMGIVDCMKKGSCDKPDATTAIRLVFYIRPIVQYFNNLELRGYESEIE